jgi:hypothetical protein
MKINSELRHNMRAPHFNLRSSNLARNHAANWVGLSASSLTRSGVAKRQLFHSSMPIRAAIETIFCLILKDYGRMMDELTRPSPFGSIFIEST